MRFCGEYPIAYVEYAADDFPVEIRLEACSPFIPLNAHDSALPATILRYTLKNTSAAEVTATLGRVAAECVAVLQRRAARG